MMKKNVLFVAMAVFALATVSCGKKAETSAPATDAPAATTDAPATTTDAPAVATETPAAEGDLLTQYDAFVDKYIALMKKVQAGDVASINELTKLNEEAASFQEKFATESTTWTQEQQEKLAAITKKFTDAVAN